MTNRNHDASDEAQWCDRQLEANGLLDSGQPTETATIRHGRRMRSEFTPMERALIRSALGIEDR